MTFEIHPLTGKPARDAFENDVPALSEFLRHFAWRHQNRDGISSTSLALSPQGQIAGFMTVTSGTILRAQLPDARSLPSYPLPVLLIARLGTDRRFVGQGVGSLLLAEAIRRAKSMRKLIGCCGILTDAKPGAVAFYQRRDFEILDHPSTENATTRMLLSYAQIAQTITT